jgi:hypothetical protein
MQSTDRARRIGRHALLWLAGPVVLVAHDRAAALAAPTHCAAALDLLAMAILRRWPELSVGQFLAVLQPIIVVLALGLLAECCDRATRALPVALTIAVMFGVSPPMIPYLALPAAALATGVFAAAALAIRRLFTDARAGRREVACAVAALAAGAAVVPSWTLACAAAAFAVAWWGGPPTGRRGFRIAVAIAMAALVTAAPLAILQVTHMPAIGDRGPWYACAVPTAALDSVWRSDTVPALLWMFGPIALTLTALGFAVSLSRAAAGVLAAMGFVILATVSASAAQTEVALAPVIVATWCAAAVGLREVVGMMRRARHGWIAVALLLCGLPVLELARVRAEERDDRLRPYSHERASLAAVTSLLNLVPSESLLVEEDASVDLLLRAAVVGGRRSSKPFAVVPSDRDSVTRALSTGTVWAFPSGQERLSLRGFAIEQSSDQRIHGLARVVSARACRQVGASLVDLSAEGMSGRITVVAARESDKGPVVLYFGGSTDYEPGPDDWSPRVRTGFAINVFDRRSPANRPLLDAELKDTPLSHQPVAAMPFVAHIVVKRTPRSPLELPIVLGPPRPIGAGRLAEEASTTDRISVCDAPAIHVSTF